MGGATEGGDGGHGGGGGDGGQGGGGGGGVSYCIWRAGTSSPALTSIEYFTGTGGLGGYKGFYPPGGYDGENGSSGTLY
ncbi:MAG: hypothetical protein NTY09_13645 [bacterium]|nr:hypothetical protein [bacterium]